MFLPISGEALLESHTTIDYVYCSPSLRCIQTAQYILQGKTTFKIIHKAVSRFLLLACYMCRLNYIGETADSFFLRVFVMVAGLQQEGKTKIRVEPGLFEWTKWVSGTCLPTWIPPAELAAANLNVDTTYR